MSSTPQTLFLLLVSALAAVAQSPVPPRPSTAPTVPGTRPPVRQVTQGNPATMRGDDPVGELEFPNSDVKDVLQAYERLTGKRLIYDIQAIGQVNIVVKSSLTRDEAIRIIEISLLMNGFTLVPVEGNLVKVIGSGHNPRGYGIPIISDEMQIPTGEQVITYVFKLRYADPTEVANTLQSYIVQSSSGYNQMLPLPKSQAIVLTENSLIIRKVLQFIREVDVAPAEVVSEFLTLDRADAKDVLEKLEKIFETAPSSTTPGTPGAAGATRRPAANRPATTPEGTPIPTDATVTNTGSGSIEINGGGTLSEDSIIIGKIKLTADVRTNRIHVVTRPVNLPFVRKLIREFDADVPFGIPAKRPLRFVAAGDVLDTVVKAITEAGTTNNGQNSTGNSNSTNSQRSGTSNRNSNFSNNNNLLGNNSQNGSFGSNSGGGGSGLSLSESLNTQERDIVPDAVIIGNTKIIADKRANTIIVLGNREVKAKIFALLDQLDVRAPQVMLHTIIGELNLGKKRDLGINYVLNNGSRGKFGTAVAASTPTSTDGTGTGSVANLLSVTNGAPVLNLANLIGSQSVTQILTAGGGGFSGFVAAGNAFTALVSALESTDRFRVVSRPSVATTNNKKAIIASGEEIAVPVNITGGFTGSTTSNGLVTQSSIQYKTVALQLEVLPLINSDREVTLDIVQKVDQQSGSDIIDNNSIPRIATRVLQTTVSVPDKGTLVLGGLIKETNSKSTSGIPGLMNLPYVGTLFRKTTNDKERTELIILIRPEVTVSPDGDFKVREREMEYLNIEPDLEATVYPPNLRQKLSPEVNPRPSSVDLRGSDVRPYDFRNERLPTVTRP